jgi:hypothetical protein
MFDRREMFGGYFRHVANHYYIVANYPRMALVVAIAAALPWLGAWLFEKAGLVTAAGLAVVALCVLDFYWVWKPQLDEEFQVFLTVSSAVALAIETVVVGISSWLAARWLRRAATPLPKPATLLQHFDFVAVGVFDEEEGAERFAIVGHGLDVFRRVTGS